MEGSKHGVLASSILIADVSPGEGPPLHLHTEEEQSYLNVRRLLSGDKRFIPLLVMVNTGGFGWHRWVASLKSQDRTIAVKVF